MAPPKSPTATFNSGVAALSTVLGLALIISVAAIAVGLISFFEIQIALSQIKSQEAYLAAQSGAQDALMKIARDKSFTAASPYSLTIGANTAAVTVTDVDTLNAPGKKQIVSTGTASNRKRRIQVDLVADTVSGAVTIISWKEVAITP